MSQPQTSIPNPQELQGLNAKWVNGVAPGYWPTEGAGLTLNVGPGTSFVGNVRHAYAGGTLALTDNTTNYVFLDTTASNAPAFNTTGYPTTGIPLATVVTSGGAITSIVNDTPFFSFPTLVDDDSALVPTSRLINTTAPLTGGGDLTADRTLVISNMTGDSGAGGAKGAVPAPGAGDTAAGKFLKADGTWSVPSDPSPDTGIHSVLTIIIDGGGSVPTTGVKAPVQLPFGAVITGWSALLDVSGSFSLDLCFHAGSAPPAAPSIPNTTTDKISASAPIAVSAAQSAAGGAVAISTWTNALTQWGSVLPNLVSVSTCQRITVEIYLTRS